MKKILFTCCTLLMASALLAQTAGKKALDHDDFDLWNEIGSRRISDDGRWVAYVLEPGKGDPVLHLYDGNTGKDRHFDRADNPHISADNKFLVFKIQPPLDSVRAMKRRKVKKDDMPGDTLAIYNLSSGNLQKVPDLKSYQLPEKWAGWLVYTTQQDSTAKANKQKGNPLTLRQLTTDEEWQVPAVTGFELAEENPGLLLASAGTDSSFAAGIYRFDFQEQSVVPLFRQEGEYSNLTLDPEGDQAAFLANTDTTEQRIKPFALFFWRDGRDSARQVADGQAGFLPEDWRISENGDLHFAEDGSRLYFGIAPNPVLPDTTVLEEEVVNVEVWNYKDDQLYTQREVLLDREKKRTFTTVWHINENKIIRLGDEQIPETVLGNEGKAPYALGLNERPYQQLISWEGYPTCKEVYLIDMKTGRKKMIAEQVCGYPRFSPEAKYVYWYSSPDTAWFAYSIEEEKLRQVTDNEKVAYYDELNDRPMDPSSYGMAGWTTEDDFMMIYDRYDIWLIDPKGNMPPNNMTTGRENHRRYRYVRLDDEERSIEEVDQLLLHYFDEDTKEEGYRWFDIHTGFENSGVGGDFSYSRNVDKAKDADIYLFSREDFRTFPDLLYSKGGLADFTKISDANPQQSDYSWGTAELVDWISLSGEPLQGILYKPDGFDPEKQYPMMVYFYERYTDRLHNYTTPRPSRSSINFAHYASRGYLVFVPDIPYRIGYPGESALHAVVPGVTSLIEKGFVDRDRIGVQGHSWGGYQVAYMITETDLFRCAESGAPVVNMFSAYGGIRWGSGLSRMFQYEHTQSRIGGTIWEYPMRYYENSPLFFTDKINTPVLILHNDEDTAVPWYQGIEWFVALRRLGKPAWLLNYNGEPHGLQDWENKKDFTRRMQQFFDFYLMDAPKPQWMETGVPPIEKGIEQGFDPVRETDKE